MASRELRVEIIGDASSLNKALGKATDSSSKFGGVLKSMGKAAALGLGALAVGAAVAGKKMIDMASDAAEVDSKLEVTFGKTLPGVTKEIEKFSEATGASRFEMREQAADMGALLVPLTENKKAAADMSTQFVELATDLGSFNNVPVADALLAIRSGLVGEAEPLRRFGVLLNEGAVKAEAYSSGIAKAGSELTEQQKVQARANLIMEQTTLAQGDATRTADSMANQMKRLKNSLSDTATEMGMKLLPAATAVVTAFNEHWPEIEKVVDQVMDALISGATIAAEAVQRNFGAIKAVAVSTFQGALDVAKRMMAFFKTDFGQTLGTGLAAVLALKTGMGALGISISGVGKALMVLKANPFWLLAIPLGLLVGEIAGNFIQSKIAAQQLADAMDKAAGSARDLKDSLLALRDSDLAVKEARNSHTAAVLAAQSADKAYQKVMQDSNSTAAQRKTALNQLEAALLNVERSDLTLTEALKRQTDAHTARNAKLREGQQALFKLTEEGGRANDTFAQTGTQQRWYDSVQKIGTGAAATSAKLKTMGDEAGSRSAAKVAFLADTAVDLARKLERVPTKKEIIAEARVRNFAKFQQDLEKVPQAVSTAIGAAKATAAAEAPGIGSAMSSGISAGFDFGGLIAQTRALVQAAIKAGRNAGSTTVDASKPIGKDITEGAGKGVKEGEEELKKVTAESVRKAVGAAQLAATTKQIGVKAVNDIIAGIVGETPSLKKQFADAAKATADATLSNAEIQALNKRFGKDIIDKVRAGMKEGTPTAVQEAAAAAREIVKSLNDAAAAALATARDNFKSAFGNLISGALAAFDAMASGWKPKNFDLLKKMDLEEQTKSLADGITQSSVALGAARDAANEAALGGDPAKIAETQARLAEAENTYAQAKLAQLKFNLQQEDAAETEAHNAKMEKDRARLEARLTAIQNKYLKEKDLSKAEIRKMNKEIADAMGEAGVDSKGAGQNIGNMLALGIQSAIGEVTKAVRALAKVLQKNWKTRSNAEEGPLSDIESWWTDLGPMLAKQIDPTKVKAAADTVGLALKTGLLTPSQDIIAAWLKFGGTKDELIKNLGLLGTTALETEDPVTKGIVEPLREAKLVTQAGVIFINELIGKLKVLQGQKATAYIDVIQTTYTYTKAGGTETGDTGTNPVRGGKIPGYQHGGIAMTPQLAFIAEAGPEVVLPAKMMRRMGGDIVVNVSGSVTSERDLVTSIRNALVQEGRRSGGNLIGGYA